jgi:hypothetical protein
LGAGHPEDEKLILPQFRPYIEQGEIASLPSYHFYMRLGALSPEEPFSGITMPTELAKNISWVSKVEQHSRDNFAVKYENAKGTIAKAFQARESTNSTNTTHRNSPLP